jgi:hypothetical protein
MDDAAAKAGDKTALSCVECGAESSGEAGGWRAYLTIDDEAVVFCPDCAEREFGARLDDY